jgi:hypothetical protein
MNLAQNLVRESRLLQALCKIAIPSLKKKNNNSGDSGQLDPLLSNAALDALLYLTPHPLFYKKIFQVILDQKSMESSTKANEIFQEVVIPLLPQERAADKISIRLFQHLKTITESKGKIDDSHSTVMPQGPVDAIIYSFFEVQLIFYFCFCLHSLLLLTNHTEIWPTKITITCS